MAFTGPSAFGGGPNPTGYVSGTTPTNYNTQSRFPSFNFQNLNPTNVRQGLTDYFNSPAFSTGLDMGPYENLLKEIMNAANTPFGGGGGGHSVGGIDPALIQNEYAIRRDIANQGIGQNNLGFKSAEMDFGRLKGQHDLNAALYRNQIKDIGLQSNQNKWAIQGNRYRQAGLGEQKNALRVQNIQDLRDLASQMTAAGAFGSAGYGQHAGTINDLMRSQLAQLGYQGDIIGSDIRQQQLQDKRYRLDIANVGQQNIYNDLLQKYGYGDLMIANSQRDLANQLVGKNIGLLNNQEQQQLASNANARANAANANAAAGAAAAAASYANRNQMLGAATGLAGQMLQAGAYSGKPAANQTADLGRILQGRTPVSRNESQNRRNK